VKSLGLAIVNAGLALSAIRFATGSGQSSGSQNAGTSARLMATIGGKLLLVVVGLVVIGVGGYHLYKGISKKFGFTAKGLVLGGAGVLVIVATLTSDPAKAAGLDAAVKSLGQAPFGKFLLILAALGIAAYGAYCFVQARFARM
jgi:Domain of Unknown Function (DUF1206)